MYRVSVDHKRYWTHYTVEIITKSFCGGIAVTLDEGGLRAALISDRWPILRGDTGERASVPLGAFATLREAIEAGEWAANNVIVSSTTDEPETPETVRRREMLNDMPF